MSSNANDVALKSAHDSPGTSSPEEGDFVVQAINLEKDVLVDGAFGKALATSTCSKTSSPIVEATSISEKTVLESPFHSPKSVVGDVMSVTTVDEEESCKHQPDNSKDIKHSSGAQLEGVVELKEEIHCDVTLNEQSEAKNEENSPFKAENVEEATDNDNVGSPPHQLKLVNPDTSEVVVLDPAASSEIAPKIDEEVTGLSSSDAIAADDAAAADEENAEGEITEHFQSRRNVPPHLRPDFQLPATRHAGVQGSKFPMATLDGPRHAFMPRPPYSHAYNQNYTYRSDGGGNELARTKAQLMKTRNELEAERQKSADMRMSVENEKQKIMDAALAVMTTDLLNKQGKTLSHQAKVDAKERELQYREARIEQLEIYLSEGQKQVYRQANEDKNVDEDGLTMADVDREHDRRQTELEAQKHIADLEGKFSHRLESLQLREAAQQMREEQYKALMRGAMEVEVRERSMPEVEAKLAQVADFEYNRGFGAGKESGRRQAGEEVRERGFFEGYNACHRSQVTLSKLRQGLVARDSPELDFIYDPAHPHNMFAIGVRVGEMGIGKERKQTVADVQHKSAQDEKKPIQEQNKPEELVPQLPPPHPTFASELRGAQNMHNGHYVLANSPESSSPAAAPKANGIGATGIQCGSMAGRIGDDVHEGIGTRVVQYKETKGDNLIDLN